MASPLLTRIHSHVIANPTVTAVSTVHIEGDARDTKERCETRDVSYSQLWHCATQLAAVIRDAQLSKSTAQQSGHARKVVVFVEEGWELPASFLAVLLLGSAFVPLDLNDPAERLSATIQDCGASVVLFAGYQVAAIREKVQNQNIQLVNVDDVFAHMPQGSSVQDDLQSGDNLRKFPPLDATAYIVYTSGSSGAPKGVIIDHRALSAYCYARGQIAPAVHSASRLLVATAATWDPALGEIFTALYYGATVVVMPRSQLLDDTARSLVVSRASHVFATPSLWALVRVEPQGCPSSTIKQFPDLKFVALGGEPIPWPLIRTWVEPGGSQLKVWNVYGLTEATVIQTALSLNEYFSEHPSNGSQRTAATLSCIGAPIGNCNIAFLPLSADSEFLAQFQSLKPELPTDWYGEICIQGSQLGSGYIRDEQMTRSRFIVAPQLRALNKVHPSADKFKSNKWLRTGDAGWFDGRVFHVCGRIDAQIKYRGRRVDLGEVEAAVLQDRAPDLVRQAVVVVVPAARCKTLSNDALVVIIVPTAEFKAHLVLENRLKSAPTQHPCFVELDAGCGGTSLQLLCKKRLPAYMLPNKFLATPSIPMGRTGKVDMHLIRDECAKLFNKPKESRRRSTGDASAGFAHAITAKEKQQIADSDMEASAAADIEKIVARVWEEVLQVPKVEPYDNFFHLGGTSIQALAMVNMLQQRLRKTSAHFDQSIAHAKVRFCGLNRKPRLRHYANFIAWMSMTAPNASKQAAESFRAVLDDKLATDSFDTALPTATKHTAENLLSALDSALPSANDDKDVAAYAMRAAAAKGAIPVAKFLIDSKLSDADGFVTRKHQGTTPISVAIRNARFAMVKFLVDQGASVNFHDDQWLSPLHVAAGVRRDMKPSLTATPQVSEMRPQDKNPVETAEDVDLVEMLVRAKAAIRARDHTRWSPLHYAAWAGRDLTIKRILDLAEQGLGMEEKQHAGSVQLSKKRKCNTAPNGANVQPSASNVGAKAYTDFLNAKDRWSRTALSWAVFRNRVDAVKLLLARGASLQATLPMGAKGKRKKAPQKRHLQRANNKWSTIVQLCLESPWRHAGDTDVLQLLLAAKADARACNSDGENSFDTARRIDRAQRNEIDRVDELHAQQGKCGNTGLPDSPEMRLLLDGGVAPK